MRARTGAESTHPDPTGWPRSDQKVVPRRTTAPNAERRCNGDDFVCVKYAWGDKLNPKSDWYVLGLDLLGEPTLVMMVHDNNANGS